MLKTVWLSEKLNRKETGCTMLLGGFDGLHIGHKKLVERAFLEKLPIGIMSIVGGKGNESLFLSKEREDVFQTAGIDFVFELPFSEIKDISPKDFARLLLQEFPVKTFVCGEDFRFGKGAQGTPEMLKSATQVSVEIEETVKINGDKVSTSTVKKLLKTGNVEAANMLLGYEYFLIGKVKPDRKIGRMIGFPTANVEYPQGKFPLRQGVYETRVTVDGKEYKGITNYGARPTFDNEDTLTETHLCGFTGELYGRELKIRFVRFLREVQKFESVNALKEQLEKDVRRVTEDD